MNSETYPYAFTGRFAMFRNRIVSDVLLCSPDNGNPNSVRIRAIWDTGCSNSIVSSRVAEFLRLRLGAGRVFRTPFGGSVLKRIAEAEICVVLGGARIHLDVGVDDKPSSDLDCDITLGLDFISKGDFAITHTSSGRICLSFCYPPIGVETDFTMIAPKFSPNGIVVEEAEIDETDALEGNRWKMAMLDYYDELAKPKSEQ